MEDQVKKQMLDLLALVLVPGFAEEAKLPAVNPTWYDHYISLKVTGPAYVPGSTKENGLWVDRIVLRNVRTEDRK